MTGFQLELFFKEYKIILQILMTILMKSCRENLGTSLILLKIKIKMSQ